MTGHTVFHAWASGEYPGYLKGVLEYSYIAIIIRIDTHKDNISMQAQLKKFGFKKMRNIYIWDALSV